MNIALSATTHPGLERPHNEDAFAVCPDLTQQHWAHETVSVQQPLGELGALLIVADGIGGFNAGEVASSIATHEVAGNFTPEAVRKAAQSDEACIQLLRHAIDKAHRAIHQHILDDFHTVGMGTTIVLAWVLPLHTHVAWCGDSRCYHYDKSGGLRPLTRDHSYVQQLVDEGKITQEETLTHPDSNIITRALGDVDCPSEPETATIPTEAGGTLLLCSDGLSGYVTDDTIGKVVQTHAQQPDKCCRALLQLALDAGGHDNIAIAVAHLSQPHPNLWQRLLGLRPTSDPVNKKYPSGETI